MHSAGDTWRRSTLGTELTFQRGFDITKAEQTYGEFAVISSSGPGSTHSEFKVDGPGVVIGRKGTLGKVFYSEKAFWPHDTTLWIKDFHGNDPKFAYYFLQTMHLEQYDCGASNPTINRNHIHTIPVHFPPLETQCRIANILSSYDNLIENNTRRIAILQEMARSLYREWFVDLRFPGYEQVAWVESDLGMVPATWDVKNLFDVAEVTYGFPFKSPLFTEDPRGKPVIRIRDVEAGISKTYTAERVADKYLVRNGDLLAGMDGDFQLGKWVGGEAYLNQRVVRFRPKDNVAPSYLYLALLDPLQYFSSTIVGTTVAHLSDRDLRTVTILVPDEQTHRKINDVLEPMLELELNLRLRNVILRRTRDLLLPRLISGELDVTEADVPGREELASVAIG